MTSNGLEPERPDADHPAAECDSDVKSFSPAAQLAREIKRRRSNAGLSQPELARKIGYTRQYVSLAEREGRIPSRELVEAIDHVLDADGALVALHTRAKAEQRDLRGRITRAARRGSSSTPTREADAGTESAQAPVPSDGVQPARPPTILALAEGSRDQAIEPVNRNDFLRLTAAVVADAAIPRRAADLLIDPVFDSAASGSWAVRTYAAVLDPTVQARNWSNQLGARHPQPLRPLIDRTMMISLASDYHALERLLPDLLGRVEFEALQTRDQDAAQRALADVYSVIGWVLIKADLPVGSWIAAQRAVRAAENAQDAVRTAAATRCLAEVHMRNGNHEKAIRTALLATVGLHGAAHKDSQLAVSLRGAALLSAAAAAARHGERREAYASLNAAARCADELGAECFELATVFGPTNVAIHRVVVAIELGDAPEALRQAEAVSVHRMPPMFAERKSRFLLDVARAHANTSDSELALTALLEAEKASPDEARHHRITHQLILQLLQHERRSSGLRDFAHRCNIIEHE